jgi:hypothetical protein
LILLCSFLKEEEEEEGDGDAMADETKQGMDRFVMLRLEQALGEGRRGLCEYKGRELGAPSKAACGRTQLLFIAERAGRIFFLFQPSTIWVL